MNKKQTDALLTRLDTSRLPQGDAPTRALVVFNGGAAAYSGVVRFAATFPVRASVGALPVVVRDAAGVVVPSRLTRSELIPDPNLPPEKLLWRMELEFLAAAVPASGYRAYAAVFAQSPESRSDDATLWNLPPPVPETVFVRETECHPGDLPLSGLLSIIEGTAPAPFV